MSKAKKISKKRIEEMVRRNDERVRELCQKRGIERKYFKCRH